VKNLLLTTALMALFSATTANATTFWTNWTSGVVGSGNSGSATGTMGGVTVTYSGEMECLNCYASHWDPSKTWEGGPVSNAPPIYFPSSGGIVDSGIQLWGGQYGGYTDTVTFSRAVTDPVLAIVSLGQGGTTASFNFTASEPFVLLGGGKSSAWGGSALTSSGTVVSGTEGNGLVLFQGTYSSISWTNPTYEYYYAVTVGSVPETSTWVMMLAGFAGLGFAGHRRTKANAKAQIAA
jgi:hypothetical protein